jgi:hypothetical protein
MYCLVLWWRHVFVFAYEVRSNITECFVIYSMLITARLNELVCLIDPSSNMTQNVTFAKVFICQ